MNPILQQLKGGDRRSIGASPRVVTQVMAQPGLFSVVFDGLSDSDPLVRMRCADAIEKITARRPEYLEPHKRQLIELAQTARQQEVRWHLAQLLPRVPLSKAERRRALDIMSEYLNDASSIVRTFSMQAMADIAAEDSELRGAIVTQLEELTRTGSPAMRSRGKKLLARLKQLSGDLTSRVSERATANIDEYIAAAEPATRPFLREIRRVIRAAAPGAEELISYHMPAFRQQGILIYFAAFKHHIGVFPPVSGDAKLEQALEPYAGSKGNLKFPTDRPIPYALIRRIVQFRLKQNLARASAQSAKQPRSRRKPPNKPMQRLAPGSR